MAWEADLVQAAESPRLSGHHKEALGVLDFPVLESAAQCL
jgi:hypothetical protein